MYDLHLDHNLKSSYRSPLEIYKEQTKVMELPLAVAHNPVRWEKWGVPDFKNKFM